MSQNTMGYAMTSATSSKIKSAAAKATTAQVTERKPSRKQVLRHYNAQLRTQTLNLKRSLKAQLATDLALIESSHFSSVSVGQTDSTLSLNNKLTQRKISQKTIRRNRHKA